MVQVRLPRPARDVGVAGIGCVVRRGRAADGSGVARQCGAGGQCHPAATVAHTRPLAAHSQYCGRQADRGPEGTHLLLQSLLTI